MQYCGILRTEAKAQTQSTWHMTLELTTKCAVVDVIAGNDTIGCFDKHATCSVIPNRIVPQQERGGGPVHVKGNAIKPQPTRPHTAHV